MKFNDLLENYPSPVIAIDTSGFVLAKNYLSSLTFKNIHVGAKIAKYTDIDFTECSMSRNTFYGNEYSYFVCKDSIDNIECYLMFISISDYGVDYLPFNPVELYRQKVAELSSESESSDIKNKKRQYIRSLHNNLLRVNYFENFKALFTPKAHIARSDETISLYSVFCALEKICCNYISEADIKFHENDTYAFDSVKTSNIVMSSILLNSLCFCIMNSSGAIDVTLTNDINYAKILMEFDSSFDFFGLYKSDYKIENKDLNAGLSLCIATEISKRCGIGYKILKEHKKNKIHYTIIHTFETVCENKFMLSSQDKIMDTLERYILSIFFDELD